MFQNNIHYYGKMKLYFVSIQELCLQKTYQDVPNKSRNAFGKYTSFLCVHKILVHAQDSCACTRSFACPQLKGFQEKLQWYRRFDKGTN